MVRDCNCINSSRSHFPVSSMSMATAKKCPFDRSREPRNVLSRERIRGVKLYSRIVNTTHRYETGSVTMSSMPCKAVASNSSESPVASAMVLAP